MYLTPREVKRQFGYSSKKLTRLANGKKIEFIKTKGGHRRYLQSSIENFSEDQRRSNGFKDETGNVYGMLTVLEPAESLPDTRGARWKCICECGKTSIVLGTNLRRGATKSCGCLFEKHFVKPRNQTNP